MSGLRILHIQNIGEKLFKSNTILIVQKKYNRAFSIINFQICLINLNNYALGFWNYN